MSAFEPIWSDIDRTKEGHVYVPDASGWGWGAIFFLGALPFLMISIFLKKYAAAVCANPITATVIYLLLSLILSIILYRKNSMCRLCGIISTIITMLPQAIIQGVYAIPYISVTDGFFFLSIEWLLISGFMLGLTVFVLAISRLLKKGYIRLIVAVLFLAITLFVVKPPEDMTWDYWKVSVKTNRV